ncbi:hypothetical protein OC834_001034 [Tilletia horrida]|nr:hypothetical protein OC834_001034 [Tilletia horrida]
MSPTHPVHRPATASSSPVGADTRSHASPCVDDASASGSKHSTEGASVKAKPTRKGADKQRSPPRPFARRYKTFVVKTFGGLSPKEIDARSRAAALRAVEARRRLQAQTSDSVTEGGSQDSNAK